VTLSAASRHEHVDMREMIILGGVTRDILRDMNVPVLMSH
jgi:nucleotide-binding universal stress UspA family protein